MTTPKRLDECLARRIRVRITERRQWEPKPILEDRAVTDEERIAELKGDWFALNDDDYEHWITVETHNLRWLLGEYRRLVEHNEKLMSEYDKLWHEHVANPERNLEQMIVRRNDARWRWCVGRIVECDSQRFTIDHSVGAPIRDDDSLRRVLVVDAAVDAAITKEQADGKATT